MFNTLLKHICFFSILIPMTTLANSSPELTNRQYSVGLDLGIGKPTNLGNPTTFPLGYSTYSYSSNTDDAARALISGISISKLLTIARLYTLQIGVSAHYLSDLNPEGNLEQGISPPYYQSTYSYKVKSYQALVEAKLRRQFNNCYFPYFYLGLGMAFNRAYNYLTAVPSYLTDTPGYSNRTTKSFSYSVGLGLDYFVEPTLSIGVGYRFINLGKVGLGSGVIRNTNVGAKLTQSNLYLNTLLVQLNYFI